MVTSQFLKFTDALKTQKSKYLKKDTILLLQIEKPIYDTLTDAIKQKINFFAEVALVNVGKTHYPDFRV